MKIAPTESKPGSCQALGRTPAAIRLSLQGEPQLSTAITVPSGDLVRLRSHAGQFPPVSLNQGDRAHLRLQFPIGFAGTPITFGVLDGSDALRSGQASTIDQDGVASFQFQGPNDPDRNNFSLYRILVTAGSTESMVQFWAKAQ